MMEFDKIEVYVQDFLYLLVLLVYRVIDDVSVLSLDTGAGVRRGIRESATNIDTFSPPNSVGKSIVSL